DSPRPPPAFACGAGVSGSDPSASNVGKRFTQRRKARKGTRGKLSFSHQFMLSISVFSGKAYGKIPHLPNGSFTTRTAFSLCFTIASAPVVNGLRRRMGLSLRTFTRVTPRGRRLHSRNRLRNAEAVCSVFGVNGTPERI